MHQSMLFLFMHLATKGIMYGTFCHLWNEIYHVQHSMDHLSYLQATVDYRKRSIVGQLAALTLPEVFAAFLSPGEYNGIESKGGNYPDLDTLTREKDEKRNEIKRKRKKEKDAEKREHTARS